MTGFINNLIAAGLVEMPLGYIKRAAVTFRAAHGKLDVVFPAGVGQALFMVRSGDDGIFEIASGKLHLPGDGAEPDVVWITGQPGFAEGDQSGSG